ncbi:MAG: hypothetical protein PHH23_02890 [Paludibacteraceae bacterium]|jgi:hypothetical protein|nr:hypothetical protein [Paludibacteraceae bacterium]
MTKNCPEIVELRQIVENSVSRRMKTPSDFEFLAGAIWERIHESISPTTLKRLWGYIDGADTTRNCTLQILSRFAGFADWDAFLNMLSKQNDVQSDFFLASDTLQAANLTTDDRIEIAWQPNRHCILRYLGDNRFEVEKSENSKLHAGNTFCCSLFILGQPLYIDQLIQNGHEPVAFVAGNKGGLTIVRKL